MSFPVPVPRPFTWFLLWCVFLNVFFSSCFGLALLILHNAPRLHSIHTRDSVSTPEVSGGRGAGIPAGHSTPLAAGWPDDSIRLLLFKSFFIVIFFTDPLLRAWRFKFGHLQGKGTYEEIWTISSFHILLIKCMITINVWRFVYFFSFFGWSSGCWSLRWKARTNWSMNTIQTNSFTFLVHSFFFPLQ